MPREYVDYDKPFITSYTVRTGSHRSAYRRRFERQRHHFGARLARLDMLCAAIMDRIPRKGCTTAALRYRTASRLLNADWRVAQRKAKETR